MKISNFPRALRFAGVASLLGLSALAPRALAGIDVNINLGAEPPPPRHEVIVERERPSPDHVWIAGYWAGNPGHYEWVPGRWERPPHPGARWVGPRWDTRGRDRVFVKGYWQEADRRDDRHDEHHDDRHDDHEHH